MKSRIILFENESFSCRLRVKKYDRAYSCKGNFLNVEKLPVDFMGVVEYYLSNYKAGQIIDWVYERYVKSNEAKTLNKAIGDDKAQLVIKKTILYALGYLSHSFILADKFIKEYEINETIDFVPKEFSYTLYEIISKKSGLLSDKVRIPQWYLSRMKRKEAFGNLKYRWAIKIWPFALMFNMRIGKSKNSGKKTYKYGLHLWNNSFGDSVPYFVDTLVDNNKLKHKDILYVMDKMVIKENLNKLEVKGYNYCYFGKMVKECSLGEYIKKIYTTVRVHKNKLFSINSSKVLLPQAYLKALRWYILWEIFYLRYSISTFIAVQEPGNISRSLAQKKHGSDNIFIFMSSSVPVCPQEKNGVINSYYSFMIYDEIISGKISIDYFKKNGNFIQRYTESGIVKSDIVYKVKNNIELKNKIKRELGIPENKIIIGFFDTGIGENGMFNNQEGHRMIADVFRLLESNDDYYILYKARGRGNCFLKNSNVKKEFDRLVKHARVYYTNDELMPQYSGQYFMGIADLVIGAITSSVVLEAVAGGIKTVCYIPPGRFNKDVFIVKHFPCFYASGYEQLEKYTNYWLNQCSNDDFYNFQQIYIKRYIDKYCDGQAIKRVRSRLQQHQEKSYCEENGKVVGVR